MKRQKRYNKIIIKKANNKKVDKIKTTNNAHLYIK